MVVIWWYCLIALTTALAAVYELLIPVLQELEIIKPKHNLLEYKKITYIVFTGIFMLAAPVVILPTVVPSMGISFRKALLEGLLEE